MDRHSVIIMGKETVYWVREPEGPGTIVMLHGFRGNHKGLVDMLREFPGQRVIAPDLPGYGESEPLDVPHTLVNYAKWLDAFIGALELEEWVSWSHSYSSLIAMIQAADGKNKPAALVSVSLAALRTGPASAISTLYYQMGKYLPAGLQQRWIASRIVDHATGRWLFMTATTKRRKTLQTRAERDLPAMNVKVVTEEYFSALDTKLEPYAVRLHVPVLVIAGAKDVIVPMGRVAKLVDMMPDGTLVVMDDQGHLAPIERPAATATITKRFIEGLEEIPAGAAS